MNKTTLGLLMLILPTVIVIGIIPDAFAAEPNKNFFNGHYYQYFADAGITWEEAKTAAESKMFNGISGHLATITNGREELSVGDAIIPSDASAWIGLSDKDTEGTYKWITGELFDYTNWNTGQPSAGAGDEDYVEIAPLGNYVYKWNDLTNDDTDIDGYVVEYLPPNSEPVLNPENGHYYQYIHTNTISWTEAKAAAESHTFNGIQGHLVTITSQSENNFVFNFMPNTIVTWIGLTDEDIEGQYKWVTGEPFEHSDWGASTTYVDTSKHYVSIEKHDSITWKNNENNVRLASAYIVEYDPPTLNPENGHYYEFIYNSDITWTDAKVAAENSTYNGASGHLVTITTANENTFVDNLVPDESHSWIGLSDEDVKWAYAWVTGESFTYTNWKQGQPVNPNGNEDYVEFTEIDGKWNNIVNDSNTIDGYVIEYGSNPVLNTQNRHYYQYVINNDITWTAAKAAAENSTYNGASGHLVTITTASENTFVDNLVPNDSHSWIGLSDETTEGQYKWVTDDSYDYTNWNTAQPSAGTDEDYVEFLGSNSKWNDTTNNDTNITGYIIEYILPTTDPTLNPANGHYYEYVVDAGISWTDAKAVAENSTHNGIAGYLATITSASENQFVSELHPSDFRPWIGLTDKDTEGQYKWVTGEPFVYSNWSPKQPDNHKNNEDYIQFLGYNDKWNDLPNDYNIITGYIIEYILPTLNSANGHYYEYVADDDITWTAAKTAAESRTFNGISGHLVTITTASENDFIAGLVPDNYAFTWIGLSDEGTEGQYKWVTGEPFDYSNWGVNQPDNYNGNEDYVQFRGYDDKWNDIKNNADYINGYIVEYNIPKLNPDNGHYYEYVNDSGIIWLFANTAAESRTYNGQQGYLATITSASENAFLADLVPDASHSWIGLNDKPTEGQYKWVTGEPFNYTNWSPGEPNNLYAEDYVEFLGWNDKWNDLIGNDPVITGYIVEYPPPTLNPDNGHYYQYVPVDDVNPYITWHNAKTAAENSIYNGVNGHLVTITTASENDFVAELVPAKSFAWIGLTDEVVEREFKWVTGEPYSYENWASGEPDNDWGANYGYFNQMNSEWYDRVSDYNVVITGYIIEYDF